MFKNIVGNSILLSFIFLIPAAVKSQNTVKSSASAVSNPDSVRLADIKRYYTLALQYKNGTDGRAIDYYQSFNYFSQAAALGDAQSTYAVAYMKYKGFGTVQDYDTAAKLFAQGAYLGRDNSEYFLALCYRNGYGVEQNEDSAQYWLKKSAALGYKQAVQELQAKAPENSNDAAKQLVQRIHNAAIPDKVVLNEFVPVKPTLPDADVIEGEYDGYVILYDWSGKHAVNSKKLKLTIGFSGSTDNKEQIAGKLSGKWMEEEVDTVNIDAAFANGSLVFDTAAHYGRKDHYSPNKAVRYDFKNAGLNIVRKGDSVYLAGNVNMFSPDRKEPSKPLFVALVRTIASPSPSKGGKINGQIDSSGKVVKLLSVYPNPFHSYVNVQFIVNKAGNVGIELYNMAGKVVYSKPPQFLNQGQHSIRVEPSSMLPAQTYLLRVVFSGGQESVTVIKK